MTLLDIIGYYRIEKVYTQGRVCGLKIILLQHTTSDHIEISPNTHTHTYIYAYTHTCAHVHVHVHTHTLHTHIETFATFVKFPSIHTVIKSLCLALYGRSSENMRCNCLGTMINTDSHTKHLLHYGWSVRVNTVIIIDITVQYMPKNHRDIREIHSTHVSVQVLILHHYHDHPLIMTGTSSDYFCLV